MQNNGEYQGYASYGSQNYDNYYDYDPNYHQESHVNVDYHQTEYDPNGNYQYSYDTSTDIHGSYDINAVENTGTSVPIQQEGEWNIQLGEYVDQSSLSSLAYDTNKEIIWCGHKNGRITGYTMEYVASEQGNYPQLHRVILYESSKEVVLEVMTLQDKIVVIGESGVRVHAVGGMRLFCVSVEQFLSQSHHKLSEKQPMMKITSSCLVTSPRQHMTSSSDMLNTFLVLGTDRNLLIYWDMTATKASNQVAVVDTPSPCAVVKSNSNVILVGGKDGKVRVYDNRFRSSKVIGTLDAHTGPVSDIAFHSEGVIVLTCGYLDRLVTQSGYNNTSMNHVSDPLIKMFDLRSSKLIGTLTMTLSTPKKLIMLTTSNAKIDRVVMVSGSGMVQISDVGSSTSHGVSPGQMLSLPMSSKHDHVTSTTKSASGHLIVCGLSSGTLLQLAVRLPNQQNPTINMIPVPMPIPPMQPPPPPLSLDIEYPSLASSYVIMRNDNLPLASSFASTPHLMNKKYHLYSNRKISAALLQKAKKHDFIAAVPNPGYAWNSLLSKSCDAYAKSDPRFLARDDDINLSEVVDDEMDNTSNQPQQIVIPYPYRKNISIRSNDWKGTQPRHQLTFDYSQYNSTRYIGLENSCPNAYANAMLQLLFSIPTIRYHSLRAQSNPIYYHNHVSLWCELGFVYHMLIIKSNSSSTSSDPGISEHIVIPSNFQRTFQQLPEVAALGLLDNSQSEAQIQATNFIRFLLQHLQLEAENETKQVIGQDGVKERVHVVDEMFGFRISSAMTYLQSETHDKATISSAQTLDLIMQSSSSKSSSTATIDQVESSFAVLLWKSMQRETKMRAWCSQSQSYERSKQLRSVISIPQLAGFLCSDPNIFSQDSWIARHSDGDASAWLPYHIEIAMLKATSSSSSAEEVQQLFISCLFHDENDNNTSCKWMIYDGNQVTRSHESYSKSSELALDLPSSKDVSFAWDVHQLHLLAVVSNIQSSSKTHNVLHLNHSHSIASHDGWILYNDFTITSSDIIDATCFPSYKRPIYLVYARHDYHLCHHDHMDLTSFALPESVLNLPSLSSTPSMHASSLGSLPSAGDVIAFDGEFVTVELSKSEINTDGQRIINNDGRQVLARISIVDDHHIDGDSHQKRVLVDDYVLPGEAVLDYVTRYSGITEEDLSPASSRHSLISRRSAYLKLRFFIDRGCVFVGHGLQKDFEIANVVIPSSQVRDTVELWRLPGQRKISLRYLASLLLDQEIQDEIHDSIEDAKTALALYRRYEELMKSGHDRFLAVLEKIYAHGNRNNWTIGLDRLEKTIA